MILSITFSYNWKKKNYSFSPEHSNDDNNIYSIQPQVQGVKGNVDKDNSDVDSIVERIKKGELKLPPSSKTYPSSTASPSTERTQSADSSDVAVNTLPTTFRPTIPPTTRGPQVSVSPNSVSSTDKYVTSASSISGHVLNAISTTAKPAVSHVTVKYPSSIGGFDSNEIVSSTTPASFSHSSTYVDFSTRPVTPPPSPRVSTYTTPSQSYTNSREGLSNLLRREGLFAMAKYLRQSGLDTVLNETGKRGFLFYLNPFFRITNQHALLQEKYFQLFMY